MNDDASRDQQPWHVRLRLRPLKDWITLGEAAGYLGISRQAVHRLVERGTLPARTVGNRPVIVVHVRTVQGMPMTPQRKRELEMRQREAGLDTGLDTELGDGPPER